MFGNQCGFRISIAAVIPIQVLIALTVTGTSQFKSLTFFVLTVNHAHKHYV